MLPLKKVQELTGIDIQAVKFFLSQQEKVVIKNMVKEFKFLNPVMLYEFLRK